MSTSRKIIIALCVLIGLPLLALIALPFILDVNQFKPQIQSKLQDSLHRPVSLGNMELKVIPFSIHIADVVIGQPDGFTSQYPFVQAQDVRVGVALLPLLSKQVKVQTIELKTPKIELIRNAAGAWNYGTGPSSGDSSSGGATSISLDQLSIEEGQVALNDLKAATPRDVYEHINLTVKDVGPGRHGSIDGSVRLDTMAALLKIQSGFDMDADKIAAKGTLTLASDRSKDPLEVVFDILRANNGMVTVNSIDAKIGSLSADVKGTIDSSKTPAPLQLSVKTASAPIADITHLAALYGAAFPPDLKVDGMLQTDVQVAGTTDKPLLSGKLSATKAQITSKDLAQPVSASELIVDFTPDALTTHPFTIETGATKVTAQATVNNYASDNRVINATLSTTGARVDELLRMANAYGVKPAGLNGTGVVSVNMKVSQMGKMLNYSGSGNFKDVSLTSPDLPKALTIANADLKFAQDRIGVDNLKAGLGAMHLDGSVSIRDFVHPDIQMKAHIDQVNVAELQKDFGGNSAPAKSKGKAAPATANPLSNITANGTVNIDKVINDQLTLTNVKATIKMAKGVVTLSPVSAGIFDGAINGAIVADLHNPVPAYAINAKVSNVDASKLLAAVSTIKGTLTGTLSASTDVKFQIKPGEDIARSLNGKLGVQMSKGRLSGIQILNQMATVARFLNFTKEQDVGTNINKLTGSFDIQNGLMNTNDLFMDLGQGTLSGAGKVNLVDQTLDLKVTTVLSKAFMNKAAGGVGGLLTTALGNQQGEMVVPAVVTGTFSNPKFTPDAAAVAKLKLGGLLPTAGNPGALSSGIKGILGSITGQQPANGNDNGGGALGGLGGLLDQLGGKKKPNQ